MRQVLIGPGVWMIAEEGDPQLHLPVRLGPSKQIRVNPNGLLYATEIKEWARLAALNKARKLP